ncbi:Ubiquitin domain-containing protein DSK2b [Ancistrocladus abbreviatus]
MGSEGDSNDATVGGAAASEDVTVNIRCPNGSKFSVRTGLDSTVGAFKILVAQNCNVPADQQRVIYKGRILKDDQTLERYDWHLGLCLGIALAGCIVLSLCNLLNFELQ